MEELRGIRTNKDFQLVFVDTPGIIPSHNTAKCKSLVEKAWRGYQDADVCLLIIDVLKRPMSDIISLIRQICPKTPVAGVNISTSSQIPVVLVLNKKDEVSDNRFLKWRQQELERHGSFSQVFSCSALRNEGISDLIDYLEDKSVFRPWMFPADMVSALSKTQQVEQLIRTYLFCWFNKEMPYTVQQQTIGITNCSNGTMKIEQELLVETVGAAKAICGTQGTLVRRIQNHVSKRLSRIWKQKVKLTIFVKSLKRRL